METLKSSEILLNRISVIFEILQNAMGEWKKLKKQIWYLREMRDDQAFT